MSDLRAPGEPGRYMPTMDHVCGFDGRDTSAPVCGESATVHLFAGSPAEGPGEWTMFACDTHAPQARPLSWDWHEIAAVCDVPGTLWKAGSVQGEGCCYWPEAEAAIHEAAAETRTLSVTA